MFLYGTKLSPCRREEGVRVVERAKSHKTWRVREVRRGLVER